MLTEAFLRPARLLALCASLLALPGCYYLHLAAGQAELMRRRQPIEELVQQAGTPDSLRDRLAEVQRVRSYATGELGLPDNGSYRSYADLGRPWVTWNVFAAPEFSVEPRRWCFPVTGCVSYRGYFDEARAQRFAGRQARRGDEVHVGPALAYSTLGHFRDPVLNTMLRYGDTRLAALIFHELAHQAAWIPGDADFNEAFASVVEEAATRRWLEREGRAAELARYQRERAAEARAAALMAETRRRLSALYESGRPVAELREAKRLLLAGLQEGLEAGLPEGAASPGAFNNARLAAAATYHRCMPALERELARLGGVLPDFYAWARGMAREPERRAELCGP